MDPVPGMFFIPEIYEWTDCPLPDYAGLRAEIRVNLRNFERQALIQARLDGRAGTVKAIEMVSPWVRDWNVYEPDEAGAPTKVAPPAEQGMAAWMRLDPRVAGWLLDAVQNAFLGGSGSPTSPPRSEPKPAPTTGPNGSDETARKPSSRRSRPSSTTPAA